MEQPAHFVILGGGTAGWLAAYILQDAARRKSLAAKFTVIESSQISTIGVGEASTAVLRIVMKYFGLDEMAFIRETGATIKLGIRHKDWRRKGHNYYGPIDDPHQVVSAPPGAPSDYLNVCSVAAGRPVADMHLFGPLLEQKKAPYALRPDGSLLPLGPFHYAYHFDQALLGQFLRNHAKGVAKLDAKVEGALRDATSGDITALRLEGGATVAGDFFIDASGFSKRLIVGQMGARWISYAKELPVNRAMPFWLEIKPGEEIPNYTMAQALDAGWMWQTPTQSRFGCGYVYSDEFKTPEEAKQEVETHLGRAIDVRGSLGFEIGRLETPWIANCLAVGLSQSFLEPLESTSIHGAIVQMMLFGQKFMKSPSTMTAAERADYNQRIGRQLDDFRSFVNLHYATERDDTPFWRDVRAQRLHPETRQRLDHWRHHMPRREDFGDFLEGLPHVETQLHYPVLDGLGLLDRSVAQAEMARDSKLQAFAQKTIASLTREYRAAAGQAMGHAQFLAHVRGEAWQGTRRDG